MAYVTYTQEQKEAYFNARLLLRLLIEKHKKQGGLRTEIRMLHIALSEHRALIRGLAGHKAKGPCETLPYTEGKQREYKALLAPMQAGIQHFKTYLNNPGAKKLYIVVDPSLSTSQKVVQASHAAAQFQKEHPLAPWTNGTLILMTPKKDTSPYASSKDLSGKTGPGEYKTIWREPDMDNKITAVAIMNTFQDGFWYHRNFELL
jgi:hypothetical protein